MHLYAYPCSCHCDPYACTISSSARLLLLLLLPTADGRYQLLAPTALFQQQLLLLLTSSNAFGKASCSLLLGTNNGRSY
jgi:hypothetical protein